MPWNSCGKRAALIRALNLQNKAGGNWKTKSEQANWSFYELSMRGFVRDVLLAIMKPELRPSLPEDREFLFRLYASTREEELRPLWLESCSAGSLFPHAVQCATTMVFRQRIRLRRTKSLKRTMSQLAV